MLLALTICLSVAVVSAGIVRLYYHDGGFVTFVVMLIVSALTCLGFASHMTQRIPIEGTEYRTEVIALKDTSIVEGSMSGNFFVFVGSVRGELTETPVYVYYTKRSDGAIQQQRRPVDELLVFEDTEDAAYLSHQKCDNTEGTSQPWSLRSTQEYCKNYDGWDDRHGYNYQLHVPPGTVARTMNLDLEK